jgi:hypothetical protein
MQTRIGVPSTCRSYGVETTDSQARLTCSSYRARLTNRPDDERRAMSNDPTLSRRGLIGVLGGGVASVAFGARALDAFGAGDANVAAAFSRPR